MLRIEGSDHVREKPSQIKTRGFNPFQLFREKEIEYGAAFVIVWQPRDCLIFQRALACLKRLHYLLARRLILRNCEFRSTLSSEDLKFSCFFISTIGRLSQQASMRKD